jgi:hypothetical protein
MPSGNARPRWALCAAVGAALGVAGALAVVAESAAAPVTGAAAMTGRVRGEDALRAVQGHMLASGEATAVSSATP